jgi:hypothetical protein
MFQVMLGYVRIALVLQLCQIVRLSQEIAG